MAEVIHDNTKINSEPLVLVEKNRYENIAEVTHIFSGKSTIEEVIKDIVISKVKDKL